jgi:phage-related minor tail protein
VADKKTELSIVIRAVDAATAKIKAITNEIAAVTKPIRDFKEALGDLRAKSGLDDVIGGFTGVGNALAGVLAKVAMVGGVVGVAVAGLFKMVDGFDELGDKAERIGVSVDFLAQMRYAAEQAGASIEELDGGLGNFSRSLGQARAGTGRMAAFLKKASPALLEQLKGAKSNEHAFDLLADAMAKLEDPAKKAALAQATLGDAALAPLLAKGAKGVRALRDEHLGIAGSFEEAAEKAGGTDNAMKKLKAATDGVKAALVSGLAPALTTIVESLRKWFSEHRDDIKEWAEGLGKRLPGAVQALKDKFVAIVDTIKPFVDEGWKLKAICGVLAAVIVGPLIKAVISLGIALATTPVGWIVAGLAAIGTAAYLLIDNWNEVTGFFTDLWDRVADKFGWAAHVIKLVMWPITGIATIFIGAWSAVSGFFVDLWDGVTSVFRRAWEIISEIVDKVVGAVQTIKDAIGKVFEEAGVVDHMVRGKPLPAPDLSGRSRSIMGGLIDGARTKSEAHVKIDIAGAPRGTRVSTDPKSTADVDTSLGLQLEPAL